MHVLEFPSDTSKHKCTNLQNLLQYSEVLLDFDLFDESLTTHLHQESKGMKDLTKQQSRATIDFN